MFSRPIACRALRFSAIATAAAVSFALAANAAAEWQGPGSNSPAQYAVAPGINRAWRLPQGQSQIASEETSEDFANPLRPKRADTNAAREPKRFPAPTTATQITKAVPGQQNLNAPAQRHASSAAVSQAAAVTVAKRPQARGARPTTIQSQRSSTPPTARRSPASRRAPSTSSSPVWQRINVAMQGPDESAVEAESLPLPGEVPHHDGDPFGPDLGPGYYMEGDAYYDPMCGPDGCGGTCGCGDACGCGGVCEPGCGCGPRQGHYGCDGECCNDCFCIGPGDPEACHTVRIRVPRWQEVMVFGGVHGFKGPYDQERDSGNFGFHEGFNTGFKIPYTYAGYQIGYQGAHSQLNGDKDTDIRESHTQHFATVGMFRRATDGLQFGTAWDAVRDERFNAADFHQLRSEISWMDSGCHEFGFSATIGLGGHDAENEDGDEVTYKPSDQYVLFYRIHGRNGGEGRFYGGWSDDSDGILGADLLLPVHDRWSVQTGFTYLIPDARNGEDGASEEAWNIHLAMVWHWDCRARKCHQNPYRPLFNVANNGYLIVDER
jgi:hypothetical protein